MGENHIALKKRKSGQHARKNGPNKLIKVKGKTAGNNLKRLNCTQGTTPLNEGIAECCRPRSQAIKMRQAKRAAASLKYR